MLKYVWAHKTSFVHPVQKINGLVEIDIYIYTIKNSFPAKFDGFITYRVIYVCLDNEFTHS